MNEQLSDFWGHPAHEPPDGTSARTAVIMRALQEAFASDEAAEGGSRGYVAFIERDGEQLISLDSKFKLQVVAEKIGAALDAAGERMQG